jgi:hypothetical protein
MEGGLVTQIPQGVDTKRVVYQEDQIIERIIPLREHITKRQTITKKTRFTLLVFIPKCGSHLAFNHIPCYTNNIHENNH